MPSTDEKVKHSGDGWIIIPNPVVRMSEISAKAKILFGVIYSLSHNGRDECFASNNRLADMAGMKRGSYFRETLASLERAKLIKRTFDKRHHRYEIRPIWTARPICQEPRPLPENQASPLPARPASPPPENQASPPRPKIRQGPTANAPARAGFSGDGHAPARSEIQDESQVEKNVSRPSSSLSAPRGKPATLTEPARLDSETEAALIAEAAAKKAAWEAARRARVRERDGDH